MTAEAIYKHDEDTVNIVVPAAGYASGQVILLPDGRAGVVSSLRAVVEGETVAVKVKGQHSVAKTASIVILDGGEVMWDHSANSATIPLYVTSKDFYLGRAIGDAASADTSMVVDLNADRNSAYITLQKSPFGTLRVLTAGAPVCGMAGGGFYAAFSPTAEAQKDRPVVAAVVRHRQQLDRGGCLDGTGSGRCRRGRHQCGCGQCDSRQ